MRTLQPAEWSKPRGFSHGVKSMAPADGSCWPARPAATRKATMHPTWPGRSAVALRRIIKLLAEAGAGPEHIVRLTWYLTSRAEYEAAGAGIGAAWRETLGRNFPPSTLLYIAGLVDEQSQGRNRSHRLRAGRIGSLEMNPKRSTSADFVTAFATGWPEHQPDIMVLSLTTQKGVQDFALTKEQALLVAKTMKETAARLARAEAGS